MLSAIVLLNTERDKTNKVAESLADLDGVSGSVFGRGPLRLGGDRARERQRSARQSRHRKNSRRAGHHQLGDADRFSRLLAP